MKRMRAMEVEECGGDGQGMMVTVLIKWEGQKGDQK